MVTKDDVLSLVWHPIENEIPIKCNSCNGKVKQDGFYSEIPVADGEYMMVVCGEGCKDAFVHHPMVVDYINFNLKEIGL